MTQPQPNNPLHGVTLKAMLEYLVAEYGWERVRRTSYDELTDTSSTMK